MSRPPPQPSSACAPRRPHPARRSSWRPVVLACAALAGAGGARAEPPPPSVTAMIAAAAATGSLDTLKTVADLAKKTNPASRAEIDAQVAVLRAGADRARVEKVNQQTLPFRGREWRGTARAERFERRQQHGQP